jgi:hypothetical protein
VLLRAPDKWWLWRITQHTAGPRARVTQASWHCSPPVTDIRPRYKEPTAISLAGRQARSFVVQPEQPLEYLLVRERPRPTVGREDGAIERLMCHLKPWRALLYRLVSVFPRSCAAVAPSGLSQAPRFWCSSRAASAIASTRGSEMIVQRSSGLAT